MRISVARNPIWNFDFRVLLSLFKSRLPAPFVYMSTQSLGPNRLHIVGKLSEGRETCPTLSKLEPFGSTLTNTIKHKRNQVLPSKVRVSMEKFWDFLDQANKRSLLVKSVFVAATFFAGMGLNATYGFIDWVRLPYSNQRDIVILLEKSQEVTVLSDTLREVQEKMEQFNANQMSLSGKVQKLEDGQLRLFLTIERIDERTLNQRDNMRGNK